MKEIDLLFALNEINKELLFGKHIEVFIENNDIVINGVITDIEKIKATFVDADFYFKIIIVNEQGEKDYITVDGISSRARFIIK